MKSLVAMVTGAGGPAGRVVSDYFQQNGIAVMRADMDVSARSDFTKLPAASEESFVPALDQVLNDSGIRLLVPTVTEELPKIAECRDSIRQRNCAVYLSASCPVRIANDKWETVQALSKVGVAVPRSYCGNSREILIETVPFPMLSKPRCGRGGRGIELHRDIDELPGVLASDRLFQEFLPGDEYDVNLFADPAGKIAACVVLKKMALKAGIYGNALSVQRVGEQDVARLAEAAVSALRLEGPLDIDVRRGLDGMPRILEINARVGANVRSAEEVLTTLITNWRRGL
ncbi:MAG TPA: ATP-grasp domain-containing protein [Terracidiphilus sp.]|nr:ATP-grasp domain-containing protein [Terracidiphilus sp.]